MIVIQLSELDLSLEVADMGEFEAVLDETSSTELQGPILFDLKPLPLQYGYLDLELLGFPYHGLSAYEIAVKHGFIGSELDWLASLKGEDGELGQAGKDAVQRAESYAESAAGEARAAAGFRTEAETYSGTAGVYAQSAFESYTNAQAIRADLDGYAYAMTSIKQESEALLTDTRQLATATIQERVKAETARSQAEIARDQAARSETTTTSAAAEASDSARIAVEARNQSGDIADAISLSESRISAYADEARTEAAAANQSKIIAQAARDEAKITAEGVVQVIEQAKSWATDSEASAQASRNERIAAQAAKEGADTAAAASLTHSQTAKAYSDTSSASATASNQERIKAETAAGQADIYRQASASSASTANGHRIAAQTAETNAVSAAGQAGQSAAAAATTKTQVEALADQAGNIYSVVAGRVTVVEGRLHDAEGLITTTQQVAIEARDKINLTYGLELNANNHIVGFKFMNNGQVGEMIITSDKFKISHNSNGSTYTPFAIDGNKLTLTGVVSINGQLIVNGTVYGSALVQDAVTSHSIAYNANTVQLANNTPVRVHGTYINVTKADSPIDIMFNCWGTFTHNAGGSFIAYVQLVRSRGDSGGTVLCTVPIYGSGMANDTWQGAIPIMYLDAPGEAGNWHYYIQVYFNVNNMTVQSITSRYAKVTELKNNTTGLTTGTGSGSGTGSGGGTGGGGGDIGGGGGVTDPNPPPGGGGGGGGIEQPIVN